jgi:hypothetical protein
MFGRRTLVTRILAGAVAAIAGKRAMAAVGLDPLDERIARGSPPGASIRRDHCSFVNDVRAALADAIADGRAPYGAERIVDCPLCRQRVRVSAEA